MPVIKYTDEQREAIYRLAENGVSSVEISRRLAAGEGPVPPVAIPARTVRRYVADRRRALERELSRYGSKGRAQAPATDQASELRRTKNFLQYCIYKDAMRARGWEQRREPRPDDLNDYFDAATALRRATRTAPESCATPPIDE
ncbi:MAG: hypothetical protein GEU88_00695 [Solirubrobacterales bacterium]|nr:hypothetical protein [Solirubrobacterales bacterium]